MDSQGAKIEQVVFDFLRPKLKLYREQYGDLARAAATSIAKVNAHADAVVVQRRRELKRAQDDYESCCRQEGADCSGFARKVQICEKKLDDALRGRALVHEASDRFRSSQTVHTAAVDQLLLRAGKLVRTADERTIRYQKQSQYTPRATLLGSTMLGSSRSGSAGLAGTAPLSASSGADSGRGSNGGGGEGGTAESSWRSLPGVEVPAGFPAGFAQIPINLITNDNPVTGASNFDAGQDLPTLRWSTDALLDVVLPAMSRVTDVQHYLTERDRQENLSGDRSYSATYRGFFSAGTAIKLTPLADGTFDLGNGRHRLWLLSRTGVGTVPARIVGGISHK